MCTTENTTHYKISRERSCATCLLLSSSVWSLNQWRMENSCSVYPPLKSKVKKKSHVQNSDFFFNPNFDFNVRILTLISEFWLYSQDSDFNLRILTFSSQNSDFILRILTLISEFWRFFSQNSDFILRTLTLISEFRNPKKCGSNPRFPI